MSNAAVESQQRAMSRLISSIESVQSLFPVLSDPVDNVPQQTWPDRMGLVDRPQSAWDRLQQPHMVLRLRQLQDLSSSAGNYLGAYGQQQEARPTASGGATIQSLFPELWDQVDEDDNREDVWGSRPDDPRRPDSPWNGAQQPFVPFAAQQREVPGPIERPQFAEENQEDWSESESEFDDDWESDSDYDSGIGSGTDTESNSSLDPEDPDRDMIDDNPL